MGDFGSRLKAAADLVGGLDSLAELIPDMSRRSLSDYVSGKTDPRAALVKVISEVTGVDAGWILTGKGTMRPTARQFADLDLERLELAIRTVERGLDEADRIATPEGKAGMIAAAYELLTIPNDISVRRILRLVKG